MEANAFPQGNASQERTSSMAINFKKKKAALVATLALGAVLAFGLAGCGAQGASSDKAASSDDKTITVAATPSPHAEIPLFRSSLT